MRKRTSRAPRTEADYERQEARHVAAMQKRHAVEYLTPLAEDALYDNDFNRRDAEKQLRRHSMSEDACVGDVFSDREIRAALREAYDGCHTMTR